MVTSVSIAEMCVSQDAGTKSPGQFDDNSGRAELVSNAPLHS